MFFHRLKSLTTFCTSAIITVLYMIGIVSHSVYVLYHCTFRTISDYAAYKRTTPTPSTTTLRSPTHYNHNWNKVYQTRPPQIVNGRENPRRLDFITRRPSLTPRPRGRNYPGRCISSSDDLYFTRANIC